MEWQVGDFCVATSKTNLKYNGKILDIFPNIMKARVNNLRNGEVEDVSLDDLKSMGEFVVNSVGELVKQSTGSEGEIWPNGFKGGDVCFAPWEDRYYKAKIIKIFSSNEVFVHFEDYGKANFSSLDVILAADFTLVCGEMSWKLSSVILKKRSPFFKAAISNELSENMDMNLEIKDLDPQAMQQVINYLNNIPIKAEQALFGSLIEASERFQMEDLKKDVVAIGMTLINEETAVEIGKLAELYNIDNLLQTAIEFIVRNEIKIEHGNFAPKLTLGVQHLLTDARKWLIDSRHDILESHDNIVLIRDELEDELRVVKYELQKTLQEKEGLQRHQETLVNHVKEIQTERDKIKEENYDLRVENWEAMKERDEVQNEDNEVQNEVADTVRNTARECYLEGERNYLNGEYAEAVNSLALANELMKCQFGETAEECADSYLLLGKALLELAIMESGDMGNILEHFPSNKNVTGVSQMEVPQKMIEKKDEQDTLMESQNQAGYEKDGEAMEIDVRKSEGANKEDISCEKIVENKDLSQLDRSWNILQNAKIIYTRMMKNTTNELAEKKLSQTLLALGKVSVQNKNWNQAVEDLRNGLDKRKALGSDVRLASETHVQLGVAQFYQNQFSDAVVSLTGAKLAVSGQLEYLKFCNAHDSEIKEIENYLAEILKKINKCEEMEVFMQIKEML